MQAQVFVVCGADKLCRINHTFFQCGIQVARGQLLRHHPQFGQYFASQAAHTEFQTFEIGHGFDFFTVPACHLRAGIAHRHIHHAVVAVERIEHLNAATHIQPCVLPTGVEAKGQGGAKTKSGVFANVEIAGTVSRFNGAVLYAVKDLQGWQQLTGCVQADFEFPIGQLCHALGHHVNRTINGVQRFRVAGRQAPANFGFGRLRPCWGAEGGNPSAYSGGGEKVSALHE